MYATCPKCGHVRGEADRFAEQDRCPSCGLIYAKYVPAGAAVPLRRAPAKQTEERPAWSARLTEMAIDAPGGPSGMDLWFRAAFLALLVVYGVRLAAMDIPSWEMASSLIHAPMVPIHEFGHILFMPFGEFMMLLGGSLFQVTLPLIFGGIFLIKRRDPFAASVMLWWSAVAVMDVAPYIYDAYKPVHVLLTGRTGDTGAHDFIDVLGDLGLLNKAQQVGRIAHAFGVAMLAASFAWGAAVLLKLRATIRENA